MLREVLAADWLRASARHQSCDLRSLSALEFGGEAPHPVRLTLPEDVRNSMLNGPWERTRFAEFFGAYPQVLPAWRPAKARRGAL